VLTFLFWFSTTAVVYPLVGYPVLLWLFSQKKRSIAIVNNVPQSVTVLVAAHNEESVIAKKIENILNQDYPPELLSIIIGADNCSDRTVEIALTFTHTKRVLVYDFQERRGKLGTVNTIVTKASGSILVFTDANCLFANDAITKLVAPFSDPHIGCVAGEKTIIKNSATGSGEGMYWEIEAFLRKRESMIGSCAGADGSIYAVRKELYPFPRADLLLMDDFIVSLEIIRKGFRCVYESQAKAHEESSGDFNSEFKRKGRILAGALNVIGLVPDMLIPFKSPIAIQLWSHKMLRWFAWIFLLVMLASNISLRHIPLFQFLLIPHLAFYVLGCAGYFAQKMGIKPKILYLPFYFLFMNYSQIYGLIVLIKQGRRSFWEKVGR